MRAFQILGSPDLDVPDDLTLTHKHSVGVFKLRAAIEHEIHALGIYHDLAEGIRHSARERIPKHECIHAKELLDRRGRFLQHHLSQGKRELAHAQLEV